MDQSPLEEAYELVKQADAATLNRNYETASSLHNRAAEKFVAAKELTQSPQALKTLEMLHLHNMNRAKFLADYKDVNQARNTVNDGFSDRSSDGFNEPALSAPPVRVDELVSSLASARGIPTNPPPSTSKSRRDDNHDPFFKFYSSMTTLFSKTPQIPNITPLDPSKPEMISNNDSFYVVPNASVMSPDELHNENANLRQLANRSSRALHAYEKAFKKQKDILKQSLASLRAELQSKEQVREREHDAEIDRLRAENERLKIQIGRMKSRWDDLKQSARKRRGSESEE